MIRKILMGIVWFFVLYFGICFILGAVAGGIAGANDPAHANEAGALAGREIVTRYIAVILIGSLLGAIIGSATGFLPGTGSKKDDDE